MMRDHHGTGTSLAAFGCPNQRIAAIAFAHDVTVVTNNMDEFVRVPGLKVEDWSA